MRRREYWGQASARPGGKCMRSQKQIVVHSVGDKVACAAALFCHPRSKLLRLIGIVSDRQVVEEQARYTAECASARALAQVIHSVPLIVPALGPGLSSCMLSRLDGLLVPGGLTNVYPSRYGKVPRPQLGPFDEDRDATSIPLIRDALRLGIPILMVCRGFQELNVALGGTLKQEPDDLPDSKKWDT
jgi:putative glutamine amidotransferase